MGKDFDVSYIPSLEELRLSGWSDGEFTHGPFIAVPHIAVGDQFTVAGCYKQVANPARKWWAFWRPRFILSEELQTFTVQTMV